MSNLELTPEVVFEKVVNEGAMFLPGYLSEVEIGVLEHSAVHLFEYLSDRAPRYGGLVLGIANLLGDPIINPGCVELPPNSDDKAFFHRDTKGSRGMTLLMPVSGPSATFYFSEVEQKYPGDMEQSRSFEYKPGDIILLRQRLRLANKSQTEKTLFNATYHHGVADGYRLLATCDIVEHAEVSLEDELYEKVAGFSS